MAVLAACAGAKAVHITFCDSMSCDLKYYYDFVKHTFVLSNASVVSVPKIRKNIRHVECLGHLSNLTTDKGLLRVIDTFRKARKYIAKLKLIIAGPTQSPSDNEIIMAAGQEFGERFCYLGAIGGEDKATFLNTIDVFLFPSLYVHEAAPQVCFEAMSAGVPFIAYDWGYINSAASGAGVLIGPKEDFVERAVRILRQWAGDPREMASRSRGARESFDRLKGQSCEQLDALMMLIRSDEPGSHAAD